MLDRFVDIVFFGLLMTVMVVLVISILVIGVPKLLVLGYYAWTEVFALYGSK